MGKSLVILTPGFPKDEDDTTCIPVLQQYAKEFVRLNPEVKLNIITFQYPDFRGHYNWNGIEVYSAGGKGKTINRPLTWLRVVNKLKQLRTMYTELVLHSYWLTETTLLAKYFAKRYKLNHVAYAIGQDVLKENIYLRFLKNHGMKVTAMSDSIVAKYRETTGRTITSVIPAGVVAGASMPDEEPVYDVIGIGSLSKLKNYSVFIDIVNELRKTNADVKSIIIGKGPEYDNLRRKTEEYNLQKNIILAGELPHPETLLRLNKSRIFLHTSLYEGQSTVIMEAIAIGLPVICFDVGRVAAGNITVCKTSTEMTEKARLLLSQKITRQPVVPYTMEKTVKEFCKIYNL